MRREDEKKPARKNDFLADEELLRGNYYRGIDSQRSILQEHFTDHSLDRPPSFSSDEKSRPGNAQNERLKQKDN